MFIFIQVQFWIDDGPRYEASYEQYLASECPIFVALPRGSGLIFGLLYYVNKIHESYLLLYSQYMYAREIQRPCMS